MKKIISLSLTSLFLFTACTDSKWTTPKAEISAEQKAHEEQIIKEQMAILEKDPANIDAIFEIAFEYQFLGQYKKAIKYYEKVLEKDSNHIVVLNNLADIYEQVEEYDKAAEYIKRLYPLMPDNSEAIKDTVRILLLTGDDSSAEQALENFAKEKRKDLKSLSNSAQLISSLKQQIGDYKKSKNK